MNSDWNWVRRYWKYPKWIREYWKCMLCQQDRTECYREMGYSVNEVCRNVFDLNELNSICMDMVFWYSTMVNHLNQDGIFMSWCILRFSWYFLGILYCILSWSRGYFHVSIKRVFSTGSEWTWPLFGQVSHIMIASIFFLMNIKEELNLTFIWSSVSLKEWYSTMDYLMEWFWYFLWSPFGLNWLMRLHVLNGYWYDSTSWKFNLIMVKCRLRYGESDRLYQSSAAKTRW